MVMPQYACRISCTACLPSRCIVADRLDLCAQLFNPYGHDNLFTYLSTGDAEWKACRKAFAKSMSLESIRYNSCC